MSLETYGWLVLAFPLAGAVLIALTSKLGLGRVYGVIGTLAIFLSFLAAVGAYSECSRSARSSAGRGRGLGLRGHQRGRRPASRSCSTR